MYIMLNWLTLYMTGTWSLYILVFFLSLRLGAGLYLFMVTMPVFNWLLTILDMGWLFFVKGIGLQQTVSNKGNEIIFFVPLPLLYR